MTLEAAIAAEREAIDADLKWRKARALRFVDLIAVDGQLHQIAFKELDTDPKLIELERRARYAAAMARGAWLDVTKEEI